MIVLTIRLIIEIALLIGLPILAVKGYLDRGKWGCVSLAGFLIAFFFESPFGLIACLGALLATCLYKKQVRGKGL